MGIGNNLLLNNKCFNFSEEEENENEDMETSDNEGRPAAEGSNVAPANRANPEDEFNFDAYDDEGKFLFDKLALISTREVYSN